MSLLEKDKMMMQHRSTEYQRKADQEAEKRRNLENEGKDNEVLLPYDSGALQLKSNCTWKLRYSQYLSIVMLSSSHYHLILAKTNVPDGLPGVLV